MATSNDNIIVLAAHCFVCNKSNTSSLKLLKLFKLEMPIEEIQNLAHRAFDRQIVFDTRICICRECVKVMYTIRAFSEMAKQTALYERGEGSNLSEKDVRNKKKELLGVLKECTHRFLCNLCQARFPTPSLLRAHLMIHAGKKFPCSFCEQEFPSNKKMAAHILVDHQDQCTIQCSKCVFKGPSERSLRSHWNMKHRDSKLDIMKRKDKICKEAKKYFCDVCGYGASRKFLMQNHMQSYHSISSFACNICGEIYRTQRSLKDHSRKKHDNNNEAYLLCELCEKRVSNPIGMKLHMSKVHKIKVPKPTTIKNFKCEKCNASYSTEGQLQLHLKIHKIDKTSGKRIKKMKMKVKPPSVGFQCTFCEAVLQTEGQLALHMKLAHQGDTKK